MLEETGWFRVDADAVGHQVLEPDGRGFAEVAQMWPEVVVDGRIDRRALGRVVFADPNQLRDLETITHPHIFDTIERRIEGLSSPVVVETPILDVRLNGEWTTVCVDSDDQTRLERVVDRGLSLEEATMRLESQPSRGEWLGRADLVIPNHGDLAALRRTVTTAIESEPAVS